MLASGDVVTPHRVPSITVTKDEVGRWELLDKGFKSNMINKCRWRVVEGTDGICTVKMELDGFYLKGRMNIVPCMRDVESSTPVLQCLHEGSVLDHGARENSP